MHQNLGAVQKDITTKVDTAQRELDSIRDELSERMTDAESDLESIRDERLPERMAEAESKMAQDHIGDRLTSFEKEVQSLRLSVTRGNTYITEELEKLTSAIAVIAEIMFEPRRTVAAMTREKQFRRDYLEDQFQA